MGIVSGEQAPGNGKCMKVCAGSTGRTTTDWENTGSDAIFLDVDISECDFIKIPTITSSIEGSAWHWKVVGTASIYSTTASSFRMYLEGIQYNVQQYAEAKSWNVEWVAVGYTC